MNPQYRKHIALASGLILAGLILVIVSVLESDRSMRLELLLNAERIAGKISGNHMDSLGFSIADKTNPDFVYLSKTMRELSLQLQTEWRPATRYFGIYSMKMDGTSILFGPESIPELDPRASPPGTEYKAFPPELLEVFEKRKSTIIGPFTDEYGTFVSAFVPIESDSGNIVLGMDLLADDWTFSQLQKSVVPIVLWVVLVIFCFCYFWLVQRIDPYPKPMIRRLFPSLICILFLLFFVASWFAGKQYVFSMRNEVNQMSMEVQAEYEQELKRQTAILSSLAHLIALDASTQKALIDSDYSRIQNRWMNGFENLSTVGVLDYFYTIDKEQICRLRLHRIQDNQDKIDRFTLREAKRTMRMSSGLEMGIMGNLGLRVVNPVVFEEQIIGYVELGQNIEGLYQGVHIRSGNQMAVMVKKDLILQSEWESKRKTGVQDFLWERLGGYVPLFVTESKIFTDFFDRAENIEPETQDIELAGRIWRHLKIPVLDAGSREVGYLLILVDITAIKTSFQQTLMTVGLSGLVLLFLIFGVIFVLVYRTDQSIAISQSQTVEREARFSQLLEHGRTIAWEVNADGLITYISPGVHSILGLNPESLIGSKCLYDLHIETGRDTFKSTLSAIFQSRDSITNLESRFATSNNDALWFATSAISMTDKDGSCLGYRGSSIDITLRKMVEAELLDKNKQLKRATEISNQLALNADTANRSKSEFLANISHEIRTPLNGIIGILDLMQDSMVGKKEITYFEVLNESAHHLLTLLNDVLDISKVEAGKLHLESLDFDLHKLMDTAINLMRLGAEKKGLNFTLTMDQHVPVRVHGDANRLRQILLNLIGNAIKFTEIGQVEVRVSVLSTQDNQEYLRFDIKDSGPGISESIRPTLFDKFCQGDSSTARKYGGTGLGLAICKELCHLMGGKIGVDFPDATGSCFWFCIPLVLPKKIVETHEIGKRVLIVEDNRINQMVAQGALLKIGLEVDIANDGFEALDKLSQMTYDLVLLDVQMPGLDGYETVKRIRSQEFSEQIRKIPVVAMTAHAMEEDRQKCLDAGMNDYTTKPVSSKVLQSVISKWIHNMEEVL